MLGLWIGIATGVMPAAAAQEGEAMPPWGEGVLEIHHINTGRGDAAFFILPDGTTLLFDAGDSADVSRPEGFKAPPKPDDSRSAGEWIGRYIRARHPDGAEGRIDYALLSHYHPDHINGLADVHAVVPIQTLMDRSWPEVPRMPGRYRGMMADYEAFRAAFEAEGGRMERFVAGRNDQVVLRRAPDDYAGFEVRNIASSGHAWTGEDNETSTLWPDGEPGQENNCSTAFILRYGNFGYFTGGDLLGRMENVVAAAVAPVDVHVANHHGSEAHERFLAALRPRTHIVQVWDSIQPRWHALDRMLSEDIHPGPRDVFLTNGIWPERRDHILEGPHAFPEEHAQRYLQALEGLAAVQGHVVVRVEPGGDRYHVIVLDDTDESFRVTSVHGPYVAQGAAR